MIDISTWMEGFLQGAKATFGERVLFVGLQGSYARGEATGTSDLDVVVILDELSVSDVERYGKLLDTLPHRELTCGFLAGKEELMHWEASDLFQFYHDTKPVWGSLEDLMPVLDETAVLRAVKIGACNLYHGCVHNMLYEKSAECLRGLYKSASFTVQAVAYLQTGKYLSRREELAENLLPAEKRILDTFWHLKNGGSVDFDEMSRTLFDWAKRWVNKT